VSRATRAVAGATIALLTVLPLAGCGVPTKSTADRAPSEKVPFGLLEERGTETSGPSTSSGYAVELYLHDTTTGRLVRFGATIEEATVGAVLRELQEPPRQGPDPLPSGNPLGDTEVIQEVTVARGLATVDLAESFSELAGPAQQVALAEIVYTATARPGVGQIRFTLGGEPVEVPRGDGSLSSEPLTRSDYAAFAPVG
jgi:Sporulation and spore germination